MTRSIIAESGKELAARGSFDMQKIYRTLVIDDAASCGPFVVDGAFRGRGLGALSATRCPSLT